MRYLLDLGDGVVAHCRDADHARRLAFLFAALIGKHPGSRTSVHPTKQLARTPFAYWELTSNPEA